MTHPQCPPATSNASLTTVRFLEEDPQYRAALLARTSKTAMRLAAAEAKGREAQAEKRADADRRIEENCNKAMRKREDAAEKRRQHKAREEETRHAKAEKKTAKQAQAAAKKQRRVDEKKEEARRKAEKKVEKARDRARKQYLGGMAWGFDPKAGVSDCLPANIQASQYRSVGRDSSSQRTSGTASSRESVPRYYDKVTGKYYRRPEFDNTWGIEVNGPNRRTPPGPHSDRFAKAMAEVDKTSRVDRDGLSREPGSSQEALPDVKGKGRVGPAALSA